MVSCLLMLCNSSLFRQVSTWMRHAEREDKDNHAKEHIVCEADDHGEHLSIEKTNFGGPTKF